MLVAYEARCTDEDGRKRMDDFYYGAKTVDQLSISVSIVSECRFPF